MNQARCWKRHITPIFNRLQCCRLYDALAADEQRRVVQLSFTGCMNFSDMSGINVGTRLGGWMKLQESGWNGDG